MDLQDQNNPAEQVEKIRDILIGQDMQQVNQRIDKLEASIRQSNEEMSQRVAQQLEQTEQQHKVAQDSLQAVTENIRHQLHHESVTRGLQINDMASKIDEAAEQMNEVSQRLLNEESGHTKDLVQQIENLSSEMNSRIDAHSRQIMEHMHREIQQWKHRMDEQISALSNKKVDREELSHRLARIASAAMGDTATHPAHVTTTNYSGPSIPRPNLGSLTGISPAMESSNGAASPANSASITPEPIAQDPHGLTKLINPEAHPSDNDDPRI
jgi:cell division protein ZapA (FtsZ GTPase activity inhibitor)